jgi:hypothetical protein
VWSVRAACDYERAKGWLKSHIGDFERKNEMDSCGLSPLYIREIRMGQVRIILSSAECQPECMVEGDLLGEEGVAERDTVA